MRSMAMMLLGSLALGSASILLGAPMKDKVAYLVYSESSDARFLQADPATANLLEILSTFSVPDPYTGPSVRPCLRMAFLTLAELEAQEESGDITDPSDIQSRVIYFPRYEGAAAFSRRVGSAPGRTVFHGAAETIEDSVLVDVNPDLLTPDCKVRLQGPTMTEISGTYSISFLSLNGGEGRSRSLAGRGRSLTLELRDTGELVGSASGFDGALEFFSPETAWVGRWELEAESAEVTVHTDAPGLIGSLRFRADGLVLYAQAPWSGETLHAMLHKVAAAGGH